MSEEHKCPECGGELDRREDIYGVVYQCIGHDCFSTFGSDEIEGEGHE
jgi:tRNA U54 and U55 pseudouridine synthase Pus10